MSRPDIVTRDVDGVKMEPVEDLVIDIPDEFQESRHRAGGHSSRRPDEDGQPRQRPRKAGIPNSCARPHRLPVSVPYRYQGTGIMNHLFAGWEPWHGAIAARPTGALVARPAGAATAYAIFNLQERGEIFIEPGTQVYEGMIIGENARVSDMDVNVTKEKKQTNMRASTADEAIRLIPPGCSASNRRLNSSTTTSCVEVTPRSIRLRKRILAGRCDQAQRTVALRP